MTADKETAMIETRKPECQLTGTDGNAFAIIGAVRKALKADGQPDRAAEWSAAAMEQESYDALLALVHTYVEAL